MKTIASILFTAIALAALPPTRGSLAKATMYFAEQVAQKQRSGGFSLGAFSHALTRK